MKLWDYLKRHLVQYKERIAFANSQLTYNDILQFEKAGGRRKLTLCVADTKEEQAIAILKCIAAENVAVPAIKEYGSNLFNHIANLVHTEAKQDISELAFLMFTSGTTGVPKGVMLTDQNIVSNLEYIKKYFDVRGMKRICIGRPLVHIAVLTGELLYALCNGLTIYFYEEAFIPQRLMSYLYNNQIEIFCATPTLYSLLAATNKNRECPLRIGVVSGEILSGKVARRIAEAFPCTDYYHVYGLTEHSPRISALTPKEFKEKCNSVGRPIDGIAVKIIGDELLVKSDSVMKGYYGDTKRTNKKICNGWLHTGDRAHIDKDGYLYIDGRIDNMIIRAGINIYPEEIELAAKDCEGVEDCLVFGEHTDYGELITLQYIGSIESKDLRKHLAKTCNPNIVPNKIEKVEYIGRSPSGKKKRI